MASAPEPFNTVLTYLGTSIQTFATGLTNGTVTDAGVAAGALLQATNATLGILESADAFLGVAGVPVDALNTLITELQNLLQLATNVIVCTNTPNNCIGLQALVGNAITQIITFAKNFPLVSLSKCCTQPFVYLIFGSYRLPATNSIIVTIFRCFRFYWSS